MDVVTDGRNPTSSGTGKSAGSEPGGSDKESDNDEKVCPYHVKHIATIIILS